MFHHADVAGGRIEVGQPRGQRHLVLAPQERVERLALLDHLALQVVVLDSVALQPLSRFLVTGQQPVEVLGFLERLAVVGRRRGANLFDDVLRFEDQPLARLIEFRLERLQARPVVLEQLRLLRVLGLVDGVFGAQPTDQR